MSIEKQKEFGLSSWAVKNRKTVYLLIVMIMFGGLAAYRGMPKENFPELQIPEIYVGIAKPGSSPKIIEKEITKPIEKEINTIKNIDEISSTSIHGYATIKIKFDFLVFQISIDARSIYTKGRMTHLLSH